MVAMKAKHIAPLFALGLSAGTLISAERYSGPYEDAAHIPPEACREQILEKFGAVALHEAVKIDEENSRLADRPTRSENDKRVPAELLEDYPLLPDYVERADSNIETYTLPESGLIVAVTRINNNYNFSPENLDFVMKSIFSTEFEDDLLRTETYGCYLREIYENKVLEGRTVSAYLIGEGELCLGRKKVTPRGHTPSLCTAQGRRRSDGVYILSRNPIGASSSLVHEVVGHEAQAALNAKPEEHKEREYFASEAEDRGREIMEETGRWILTAA